MENQNFRPLSCRPYLLNMHCKHVLPSVLGEKKKIVSMHAMFYVRFEKESMNIGEDKEKQKIIFMNTHLQSGLHNN